MIVVRVLADQKTNCQVNICPNWWREGEDSLISSCCLHYNSPESLNVEDGGASEVKDDCTIGGAELYYFRSMSRRAAQATM